MRTKYLLLEWPMIGANNNRNDNWHVGFEGVREGIYRYQRVTGIESNDGHLI